MVSTLGPPRGPWRLFVLPVHVFSNKKPILGANHCHLEEMLKILRPPSPPRLLVTVCRLAKIYRYYKNGSNCKNLSMEK